MKPIVNEILNEGMLILSAIENEIANVSRNVIGNVTGNVSLTLSGNVEIGRKQIGILILILIVNGKVI